MREIKNECAGSGRMPISTAEALRRWVHCSACGKALKVRVGRENEATLPRHSRLEAKS